MMDAIYVMGAVNLLLCAWVVHLQSELRLARLTSEVAQELIKRLAIGEIEFERNGKEIRLISKGETNETA